LTSSRKPAHLGSDAVTADVAVAVPVGWPAYTVQPAGTSAAASRAPRRASGERVAVPVGVAELEGADDVVAGDEVAPPVDDAGPEHPPATPRATATSRAPPDDLTW
jgi:hypothetical protein